MRVWCAMLAGVLLGGACDGLAQERPKITGISHLSVYTSDAAKAEQFYGRDLGGFKAADPENAAGMRFYFSPVQFIEVLPLASGAALNRLDHTAYNTVDADGLRRYMGVHGVTVPEAVTKGSDGSRYFFVKDPDGLKVEFVEAPAQPPAVPVNALSHHIIHVGAVVHDVEADNKFYREVLGFRPYWHGGRTETTTDWVSQQVPDGTDWFEYMLTHGTAPLTQQQMGGADHFSLGVRNMEETMTTLAAGDRLGMRHSPMQLGRDGKWQLNLFDPDETRAELMEFKPVMKSCCSEAEGPHPSE